MLDFASLNAAEADAYCDSYVRSLPSRRAWLAAEFAARPAGGHSTSSRTASLETVWEWATALIDTGPHTLRLATEQPGDDPQQGPRPPWYDQSAPDPYLSDGALWLIELLGVHLADALAAEKPEAHWAVYRSPERPDDYNQQRTMLFDAGPQPVDPAALIHTSVIGHVLRHKPWTAQATLASLYLAIMT